MSRKILYLGLNPPEGVIHYPVIRTELIHGEKIEQALYLWPQFSHVVFTSKTTVGYWFAIQSDFDKVAIAIGEKTAKALQLRSIAPLIAWNATQEGIIELLDTLDVSYLFFPRSKRARPLLASYLKKRAICHFILDLYDTLFQKPKISFDWEDIGEIVFTSPSTIEGFLRIFGAIPKGKILTPIGPVTARALGYVLQLPQSINVV